MIDTTQSDAENTKVSDNDTKGLTSLLSDDVQKDEVINLSQSPAKKMPGKKDFLRPPSRPLRRMPFTWGTSV